MASILPTLEELNQLEQDGKIKFVKPVTMDDSPDYNDPDSTRVIEAPKEFLKTLNEEETEISDNDEIEEKIKTEVLEDESLEDESLEDDDIDDDSDDDSDDESELTEYCKDCVKIVDGKCSLYTNPKSMMRWIEDDSVIGCTFNKKNIIKNYPKIKRKLRKQKAAKKKNS